MATWGGTTIAKPTTYQRREELVGAQFVLSDGALTTDYVTTKARFALGWELVTSAEKDTIVGKATTQASAALVVDGETSINVTPVRGTLNVIRLGGATQVYNVTCEVRET